MNPNLRFDEEAYNPPPLESLRTNERQNKLKLIGPKVLDKLGIKKPAVVNEAAPTVERESPYEIYKLHWQEQVTKGIEDGWLDESARSRMKAIDTIAIKSIQEDELAHEGAMAQYHDGTISVGHGQEAAIIHELNHALLAGSTEYYVNGEDVRLHHFDRWMEEALTEHIAEAMNGHSYEAIDTSSGSYQIERDMLAELLSRAGNADGSDKDNDYIGVTIRQLTQRYSAQDKESPLPEVRAFTQLTSDIWKVIDTGAKNMGTEMNQDPNTRGVLMAVMTGLLKQDEEKSAEETLAEFSAMMGIADSQVSR